MPVIHDAFTETKSVYEHSKMVGYAFFFPVSKVICDKPCSTELSIKK